VAFAYFAKHNCDVVILEVGLGGRLDSTNVIEHPLLSIITDIDLDHTAILGDTIEAIATEKAGIIKPHHPCLYGGRDGGAERTIRQNAQNKNAPYHRVDRTKCRVTEMTLGGTVFDFGTYKDLHLSLLGGYQPSNASIVLEALSLLANQGFSVSEDAIRQGLSSVYWPARFELLRKDPTVLYDGGHNPQGIEAAVNSIKQYFGERKVNILTGVMQDKNYRQMVEMLAPVTHKAFTVRPENPRALSAEALAETFAAQGIPATPGVDFADAVRAALTASRRDNRPLVALGSLYLYCSVANLLKDE
jgi:dihydrofolate synthase/folylpolyglutamate synthase